MYGQSVNKVHSTQPQAEIMAIVYALNLFIRPCSKPLFKQNSEASYCIFAEAIPLLAKLCAQMWAVDLHIKLCSG